MIHYGPASACLVQCISSVKTRCAVLVLQLGHGVRSVHHRQAVSAENAQKTCHVCWHVRRI
jgi:hypothetical protein